jgi:hypothetical protein
VTTTTGRVGNNPRTKAARKGWADTEMPSQRQTPPFSSRRTRPCPAGVWATAANGVEIAGVGLLDAKRAERCRAVGRGQHCSDVTGREGRIQALPPRSAAVSQTSRSGFNARWLENPKLRESSTRCGWCFAHSRAPQLRIAGAVSEYARTEVTPPACRDYRRASTSRSYRLTSLIQTSPAGTSRLAQ